MRLETDMGCPVTPDDPTAEELASEAREQFEAEHRKIIGMAERIISHSENGYDYKTIFWLATKIVVQSGKCEGMLASVERLEAECQ